VQEVTLIQTGTSDYREMWDLQNQLHQSVVNNSNEQYLILTEHKPVITIGKTGSKNNLLANPEWLKKQNIEVIENDRGGDITFHGPGQIVGYPILNLAKFKKDIHWYLRAIEDVIIKSLGELGLTAERQEKLTGVWIENRKICAIGVKTSRWVTMHGFALNVLTNLDYFKMIVPCGINDKGVTSISHELGNTIDLNQVINILVSNFQDIFRVKIVPGDMHSITRKIKE
jgi:lipoyl(octanoyl) transferase